jgi:hypothetical protein
VLLGLFCKLKFDESGLGGNFLLVAKSSSFLPQPNSSTSHYINARELVSVFSKLGFYIWDKNGGRTWGSICNHVKKACTRRLSLLPQSTEAQNGEGPCGWIMLRYKGN